MNKSSSAGRAWITGGGTGIGRALALLLAGQGWQVVVSGRRREPLDEVVAQAEAGSIVPVVCDVTDLTAVRDAVRIIESEHGPLDLAVLNAGIYAPYDAREFGAEYFREVNEVNYMGVIHGIDAVFPYFKQRGRGQIGVVASVAGYMGLPMSGPYGASKAALINLCESLKFDFDQLGIRLSVINPGFIRTPLTDQNKFRMPFLAEPEDMAKAIWAGLQRGDFEITYPKRLAYPLKA
ncbi:MAG: SDR family NAD(P)-dependent oxidoreductase, partial [Burkholderiales bacterium]